MLQALPKNNMLVKSLSHQQSSVASGQVEGGQMLDRFSLVYIYRQQISRRLRTMAEIHIKQLMLNPTKLC